MSLTESTSAATVPDLVDPSFWARPYDERVALFEELRALPQPAFVRQQLPGVPWALGYRALVKYADIVEVSRRPQDFSSQGATSIVGMPPELDEYYGSMINMDNPEHARLRRIVSASFGRATVPELEARATRIARGIIRDLVERGPGDFVRPVAAEMPIAVLGDMMGLPEEDHDLLFDLSNKIVEPAGGEAVVEASRRLGDYIAQLREDRLAHPRADVITKLVRVQADGEYLNRQELVSFFILLVIAGMETTRNAISHALVLLTEHPEQRRLLLADFDRYAKGAVEEVLRVSTPINWMRRVAARDCEMNGHRFRKGDRLFLFYWSANRDASVFPDPYRFDITRGSNAHLTFGAVGPHVCLGAHLARLEITVLYRELLAALPEIRAVGQPHRLDSSFIEGIKQVRCAF
ncbi:cytochrome P450 [Streptomyces acidiscabies]|uniref:Cytochrome P450 n=1 Tax=Streptomyces acidiscabies TaxID=42234 RepID=A0AAP6BEJ9_9ACTN|nr:cytochrome P450 [Streptomyces acidiscabies]MBP5941844.1 cytochrome P450 [Streptomyces sp. LBUM 1476]MBZ3913277.1 cytochrome P450 [Streptomyces acidiscabies]MDX2963297.1 cytochrome P450 [Streptomyces acidiscabies]MDX3021485.1 cytochrome P450 [Streptomyces acidiscabies]MDX3790244.1 cytochrome P450 [Streptomyces acidiscabies]